VDVEDLVGGQDVVERAGRYPASTTAAWTSDVQRREHPVGEQTLAHERPQRDSTRRSDRLVSSDAGATVSTAAARHDPLARIVPSRKVENPLGRRCRPAVAHAATSCPLATSSWLVGLRSAVELLDPDVQ